MKNSMLFGFHSSITPEQKELLDAILSPCEQIQMVIVNAKAGTGKTLWSVAGARLRQKPLIYTFATVEEDKMGFLPGDRVDKEAVYLTPLKQALIKIGEIPSKSIVDPRVNPFMNQSAWVTAQSHTFERGVNYEDCTLVIDEAQNWTLPQLRKVLTRCHDSVKVIMIGHSQQCDLADPSKSGFEAYSKHMEQKDWVKQITLSQNFRGRLASWSDEI